jgi:hypothetical protein
MRFSSSTVPNHFGSRIGPQPKTSLRTAREFRQLAKASITGTDACHRFPFVEPRACKAICIQVFPASEATMDEGGKRIPVICLIGWIALLEEIVIATPDPLTGHVSPQNED